MTTAIEQRSIDFHGDVLVVIHQGGIDYTPLKPFCDILGIDWEGQRQRIERDEVLTEGACVIQAPSAGGPQQMLCLPLDYLNGWLFGVEVSRIRPELRERLILYKRECYRALARAFRARGNVDGGAPLARVEALEDRVARLEGAKRPVLSATEYLSPQQTAIITILKRHAGRPVSARAIMAELRQAGHSISTRTTNLRLRRMAARGLIVMHERSVYRLV